MMKANATTRRRGLRSTVRCLACSACVLFAAFGTHAQGMPVPEREVGTIPRQQPSGPAFRPQPQTYGSPRMAPQGFGGQAPGQRLPNNTMGRPQTNTAPRGEHLQQWMQQHGNMSSQQQQRALEREPGFSQLPQATQQRMMDRLNRLNSMPEQQRQRVLQRGEALERLAPQQRVQVRSAMGQLGALPEDRRRAVARSFRELRTLPPDQRNQMLNSPEYRREFSDEERGTLGNLLSVSPLLPPSR